MSIALAQPTTARTAPSAAPALRLAGQPAASQADAVTVTLTVTLPPGTGDVEAALLADTLRTHAQRVTATRPARTTVAVSSPQTFTTTGSPRALPPQSGRAPISPLRPRRQGVVSANSPARRDAEAARRRALQATAVSPASATEAETTGLVVDLYGRRVRLDGCDVDFTYKEFELLAHLARRARSTVSRDDLLATVWAGSEEIGERTVDVHVRRVRAKLGRFRKLISTVRGCGYRLDPGSDVALLG